ncbi:MAG: hypothetical protein AB7I42_00610 [Bradyrhizobium sp.]|uniref:hypothetical protein n=1 Tax=Bradyrhizobium sp. TaxID=376 RepID=UPI003D0CA468
MSRFLPARELLVFAAALVLADVARAELVGAPSAPPTFSREETQVIERNAALARAVRVDPWTVRRLLDAVAKPAGPVVQSTQPDEDKQPLPATEELDPASNPDLPRLQRASPEAVNDLFQLLKLAGAKQKEKK